MTHLLRRCAVLLGLLALVSCGKPEPAPQIAAAADLRLALTDAAAAFEKETGEKVVLNFGASGNLTRQLQQGAPFELFLSADESYVTQLVKAGKTRDEGRLYAIGRLALIAPKGSPLRLDSQLAGLREALALGDISRFAIANPEHAPYGRRAQEALDHAGLWKPLQDKLVLGENVSQALQFATEGGAQGGIVAHSLVLDPAVKGRAAYVLIPADWHTPLRQRMVLMNTAGPVAERFYAYLAQPAAKAIFAKYGFTLPAGAL